MSKRRATLRHRRGSVTSTISLLCIICAISSAARSPVVAQEDPDSLYANRTDLHSARRAAELWTVALSRNPKDYQSAWKLAQADYWLGGHVSEKERTAVFEDGIVRGRTAMVLEPNRPEGHFWLAANLGAIAELSSRAGLKYRSSIKEELETVRRIDPAFLQGSADRALGRWYAKVPRLFGGDRKLAEQHLRESLKYNAHSTASHFFLAELMIDDGRREEARAELRQVIDAPRDPDWDPEDQEFKAKARAMVARLK